MSDQLYREIEARFGVLPNFFRFTVEDVEITANLWGFARFAYLDNPLPSLFKERLFVYLSRFCEVKYCVARHLGFLVGLGHPAGDASCLPQKVPQVLPLLRRPLSRETEFEDVVNQLEAYPRPLAELPASETADEIAIFACAAHLFLQTHEKVRAERALRAALGGPRLERLHLFLAFIRMAHYWTELHPKLEMEQDIRDLLSTHVILSQCILSDDAMRDSGLRKQMFQELDSLRVAYQGLSGKSPSARRSTADCSRN